MRIGYGLAAGLAALFLGGPVHSKDAPALSQDQIARIESTVTTFMAAQHVPGMSVALVIDGHPAWSRGFGLADIENTVPATAATAYRSASIGKSMTATAAMRLVESATRSAPETCGGRRLVGASLSRMSQTL